MGREIAAGYKQTEIGIIPDDWEVLELKNFIFELKAGISVNSVDEKSNQYSHEQAVLKTSAISNGYFYPEESKKIIPKDILRAKLNPTKDLIIISRMNTPALVGECGYIDKDYPYLFLPDRLWQTTFKKNVELNSRWLAYLMSFGYTSKAIKDTATGTSNSMKNIAKEKLLSVKIPSPPSKTEQTAIATALSDVDALISGLDNTLAKKRLIKKGAMQELLTGKKRLAGFSGEWEVKKVGEFLKVKHGKSQKEVESINGQYPILGTGGLMGYSDHFLYDNPSVLIGRKGTIDKPQFMDSPFWTVDTLFYTEIFSDYSPRYIYYIFLLIDWYSYNEASGVPSLNAKTIENIEITMAPTKTEQTAIAKILTEINNEIEALEKRRTKTLAIKQGMMQELLTGKTRLI